MSVSLVGRSLVQAAIRTCHHSVQLVLLYAETLGSPRSSLPASKEFGSRREGRATSCSTWRSRLGHHPLRRLRCSRGVSFQGTCRCAGSQPCTNEALESVRQWCILGTRLIASCCPFLSMYTLAHYRIPCQAFGHSLIWCSRR